MCLLIVAKPNFTPKKKFLRCACDSNPHGFGFAFHTGAKIYTFHSLDALEAIDAFYKMRVKYPEAWAMFHARYATHGSVSLENCHPFKVGGSKKTILGHNGILPLKPKLGDDRSDTRLFADDFLPEFGMELLDDERFWDELEDFCAGSKIAIFTTEAKNANQIYIVNERLGHWSAGVWYSNNSYLSARVTEPKTNWMAWHNLDEKETLDDSVCELSVWFDCLRCGFEHENAVHYCKACNSCIECGANSGDCLCYVPDEWEPQKQNLFFDF